MNKHLPVLIALLGFGLVGCASTKITVDIPYDGSEVQWSLVEGSSSIEGDAFLQRNDGMLVKCSGRFVWLTPFSSYEEELVTKVTGKPEGGFNTYGIGRKVWDADEDYMKMSNDSRKSTCDVDGKFAFKNIPAGTYYISTEVVWKVDDYFLEGGGIVKKITVKEGESLKISLTSN